VDESIRLGRFAGIAIGINWSLLVIAGLLGWALGYLTLPSAAPHYGWAAYTLAAAVVVVCFFGALLAHELAHSLVARRRGVQVDRITRRRHHHGGARQPREHRPDTAPAPHRSTGR
jgi:Zn-dependent protease